MDEEILARLLTFKKDSNIVMAILLKSGKKMITDGKKILSGKISGDIASFIIRESNNLDNVKVVSYNNEDIYLEKINMEKYLNSIGYELCDDLITPDELKLILKDDNLKENFIIVDIRSPREHNKKTIEGAINIPIFLDDEYELIGKTYKKNGKEKAIGLAYEILENSLKRIIREISKLDKNKEIIVFCARGGMRGRAISTILKLCGFKVRRLVGGFKGYCS